MSQLIRAQLRLTELLKHWEAQRLLTPLDRHFALQLHALHQHDFEANGVNEELASQRSELFLLICALLSKNLSAQHTCLPLEQINLINPMQEQRSSCRITLSLVELTELICGFLAVGQGNDKKPLVFDKGNLYLSRYYQFETIIAQRFSALSQQSMPLDELKINSMTETLAALYPQAASVDNTHSQVLDWQKIATATAATKKLAVITGGPGTGKTTTVTKLLFLLCQQQELSIKLVAPTGKAAARLSESIKASKQRLAAQIATSSSLTLTPLERIPEEASTLHRLLGVIPNSSAFRHHSDNPLRLDLLIIDEASMVDLPMMYKLLDALPAHARLILLGDQDQLASVEAGAVLADICYGLKTDSAQNPIQHSLWQMRYSQAQAHLLGKLCQTDLTPFIHAEPKLGDSLCMLMHSHRFKGDAGIGQLAKAVNQGDLAQIQHVWQQGYNELRWLEHQIQTRKTPNSSSLHSDNLGLNDLLEQSVNAYQAYLSLLSTHTTSAIDPQQIIEQYNQYRILCAMRAGEYGVDGINQSVTTALAQAKLINPIQEFYLGRPIIIQSNDYNLGLFNGDIGLILQDEQKPERLMAHFIQADGSLLKVLPARLPQHETCYAMTVHKSQGSEFAQVALVLPESPSVAQKQLLSKELVYTAITRAKKHFSCLGSQKVFEQACSQATKRASGLATRLWHAPLDELNQ